MKNLIIILMATTTVFVACQNHSNKTNDASSTEIVDDGKLYACPMHPDVQGKKGEECSKCGMELTEQVESVKEVKEDTAAVSVTTSEKVSIDEIITNYLSVKNALTKDDSKAAGTAATALTNAFAKVDVAQMPEEQSKAFNTLKTNATEQSNYISNNAAKIEKQREHFSLLSKNVYDLLKTFQATEKLYNDFCPMYNDGKGATWISETKEIKNPYYGKKMLSCGKLQGELK